MSLLEEWLNETSTSAIPRRVKELLCYLTVAQWAQAHTKTIWWRNRQNVVFPLEHAKVVTLSCILTGDPGSYKSEGVRFMRKVIDEYNNLVMVRLSPTHAPIPVFPYDRVSDSYLLSELVNQSKSLPPGVPCTTTIIIDELINFLNRKDHVEPLVGLLNSLLDQLPRYAAGTQKRGGEVIDRPSIVSIVAACAPSWFKYLPESLFTGGFSGRCMMYYVPYPKKEERQPLGKVSHSGAASRLAELLYNLPQTDLVMTPDAIDLYKLWEHEYGEQRIHPLQAVDEWYKRRCVQISRLASCIALARNTSDIDRSEMNEANDHMEWVKTTLERVWEELDSDDSVRFRMLCTQLQLKKEFTEQQLLDEAVGKLRNTGRATSMLQYMKGQGLLVMANGKWLYKG